MSYKAESFGRLPDGREVRKVTISNEGAAFSVITLGAIITSFMIRTEEGMREVICSSSTLEGYIGDGTYKGQVVAPNANRIREGVFTLDGRTCELDINNGPNNLHSGSANTGAKLWNIIFNTDDSVVMNTGVADGEGGFPGNTGVTVTYTLKASTLEIKYTVSSDADTPVNPTNHAYFNLHSRKESIKDHVLQLNADRYVAVGPTLIPTGCESVEGTDYDFRTPHAIGERRDGRYDNCFIFADGALPHASVSADGLVLEVETDRPGMQVYAGEFFSVPDSPWGELGPFNGVALETSGYPDAVNHPEFPSVILRKGEVFKSVTRYTLREGR